MAKSTIRELKDAISASEEAIQKQHNEIGVLNSEMEYVVSPIKEKSIPEIG